MDFSQSPWPVTDDSYIPNEWTYVTENGTIQKSHWVGFSMPATYFYSVLETGEKFSSMHKNIRQAYKEWVAKKIENNEPFKMVVD